MNTTQKVLLDGLYGTYFGLLVKRDKIVREYQGDPLDVKKEPEYIEICKEIEEYSTKIDNFVEAQ